MNIIRKIRFHLKVWRRTLSIDDFALLLAWSSSLFDPSPNEKMAQRLLKKYFKHPLSSEELTLLADEKYLTAQNLFLEALKQRPMTDKEQNFLVGAMPWNFLKRFPAKLSDAYVSLLLAKRNPLKIAAYCHDFDLPSRFEKELLAKYRQSLMRRDEKMFYRNTFGKTEINGWHKALISYLEGSGNRFLSIESQSQILDFNDDEITQKLVSRASIADHFIYRNNLKKLIENNNVEAVRLLLRESYIIPEFKDLLFKHMPQLKTQYDIAEERRYWYEKEQKDQCFYGAQSFTPYELNFVLKHQEMSPDDDGEFKETYIIPFFGRFGSCMRAYIGYYYPDLIDKLVQ